MLATIGFVNIDIASVSLQVVVADTSLNIEKVTEAVSEEREYFTNEIRFQSRY
jgi:hypothetical protein